MAPPETGYCSTVQAVYYLHHCIMYFAYYSQRGIYNQHGKYNQWTFRGLFSYVKIFFQLFSFCILNFNLL